MAQYRIELTPDDNDTFLVTAPAFPEVTSFGDDEAACQHHGSLAVQEAIAGRIAHGEDIPEPDGDGYSGPVADTPLLMDLKAELYKAARSAGITRADMVRRLGWNRNSVDRLFDVNHASRLDKIEAAMSTLGYRIEAHPVRVRELA